MVTSDDDDDDKKGCIVHTITLSCVIFTHESYIWLFRRVKGIVHTKFLGLILKSDVKVKACSLPLLS